MPIALTISTTDRMVVADASGDLTLADLAGVFKQMLEAHVLSYRKIFVLTSAMPVFSNEELSVFAGLVRSASVSGPRGALALVADPNRGEFAHAFAAMAGDDRPVKVFRSIHEARTWLADKAISPLR